MQGATVVTVRALTDCLEMYLKELAILHGIHFSVGILGQYTHVLNNCKLYRLIISRNHFYRLQRSCEGYVFTRVCLSTGGGVSGQVHPPTRYTPHNQVRPRDQVHPPGPGTPPRTRYTPPDQVHPPRRLLFRTVRILLECILFVCFFDSVVKTFWEVSMFEFE